MLQNTDSPFFNQVTMFENDSKFTPGIIQQQQTILKFMESEEISNEKD